MANSIATQVKKSVEQAFANDGCRIDVLEDCARFAIPREQDLQFLKESTEGDEKPQPVDGLAVYCLNRFINFIYSNTIGTLSNLFVLRDLDEKRNNLSDVNKWYSQVSEILIKLIQGSNLSGTAHEMMASWAGYGQGFHSLMMDELTGRLKNRNYSANSDIRMSVDADGVPDGIYMKRRFTARQALDKFGEKNLPEKIVEKAKKPDSEGEKQTYYYRLGRRQERKRERKIFQGMEWEGVWVVCEGDKEHKVSEAGFRSFPFQCPRFNVVDGETYGRGLVHQAMYDVRAKQRSRNDWFNSCEKAIDPTLITNDEELADNFDNTAGALNYAEGEDVSKTVRELGSGASASTAQALNEEIAAAVRQSMMTDLIDVLERDKVYNNPQTLALIDQQLTALLPGVTRLRVEFFEAYVVRVLDLVLERDDGLPEAERMLPPPPKELLRPNGGFLYAVSFTMRIDEKIKAIQNQALLTFIEQATFAKQAYGENPKLAALIPEEKALRHLAVNNSVDGDLINSDDEYATAWSEYMTAQQEAQAQQALLQGMQPVDPQKAAEPGSPMEGMING